MSIKRIKQSTWYGILGMPLILISFVMWINILDVVIVANSVWHLEWHIYMITVLATGISVWLMTKCTLWEEREIAIRNKLREEKRKHEIVEYIRSHPDAKTFP